MLIVDASWIALLRIVSSFGSVALAAYTIIMRLVMFTLLPVRGPVQAAATLVGQNLGAGNPQRAAAPVWRAGLYGMACLAVSTVVFLVVAEPLVRLLTAIPRPFASPPPGFATSAPVLPLRVGHGDDQRVQRRWRHAHAAPAEHRLLLAPARAARVPPGAPPGLGPDGVFLAMPISFSVFAVLAIVLFRRGRWRHRKL